MYYVFTKKLRKTTMNYFLVLFVILPFVFQIITANIEYNITTLGHGEINSQRAKGKTFLRGKFCKHFKM